MKGLKTIYVVTEGEYSDKTICAVYSDKKLAEQFFNAFCDAEAYARNIEEWILDPYESELTDGYKSYFVRINKSGFAEVFEDGSAYRDSELNHGFDIYDGFYNHCFAKNEDHAIEITRRLESDIRKEK